MSGFHLSTVALDAAGSRAALGNPAAGGYASFEGWVRNHNEGRDVLRLEYEACAPLAIKEGERILAEARARFPLLDAACMHRVGALAVGDMAVWVGVSAQHREAAFAACRYIIDEVKRCVPIWKKEHYADGDSGWVNCEHCAHPHALQAVDYSRQIALREIGRDGQQKLRSSRVLVIGAGGLGAPVLSYLAGAGVGTLDIVDGDRLEASNLHRQPLYAHADIGKPKAGLAAARIRALNPDTSVHVLAQRFCRENASQLVQNCDLAIDCSDNFASKFLLNDACVQAGKPVIFASVYQYEGQLQVYRPESRSACLRCLWPEATRDGIIGNCATAGVLGPVPGVLGSLQALEAIKQLLQLPGRLDNELLILDLSTLDSRKIRTARHAACQGGRCARIDPLAGQTSATAATSPAAETTLDLQLNFGSLAQAAGEGYNIVDIREDYEVAQQPIAETRFTHIPLGTLLSSPMALDPGRRQLLVCAHGVRSLALATELRRRGVPQVYSLSGGLAGPRLLPTEHTLPLNVP